jgi:osmotically-inducible protein OsmY
MRIIQLFIFAGLISIFVLACGPKNMDDTARQPAQPISNEEESANKPAVTEDTKAASNTPSVAEGTGSSVTESGRPTPDESTAQGTPTPGGAAETVGGSTDISITNAIRDKFAQSTLPSASRLKVEARDGVVTLKGEASTQAEVNQILELVREVPGVKRVINQIEVLKS